MILITGANGNLGRRLVSALRASGQSVRAVVRRADAVTSVGVPGPDLEVRVVDYLDGDAMREAVAGCSHIVHLVGILKESSRSSYADSHEHSSQVLVAAAGAAGVRRIVYLSIVGSTPASANACLASKGRAEQILRSTEVPVLVLRVPMVLGEGDYASSALQRRTGRRWNVLLRGASLEQPIYAGDVVDAICAGLGGPDLDDLSLDLAGPESLPRRELIERAAAMTGNRTRIISLPLGLGMLFALVLEKLSKNPPVTRAMLGVLDHDDALDPRPACARLGIQLTELSTMLERILAHR